MGAQRVVLVRCACSVARLPLFCCVLLLYSLWEALFVEGVWSKGAVCTHARSGQCLCPTAIARGLQLLVMLFRDGTSWSAVFSALLVQAVSGPERCVGLGRLQRCRLAI